MDALVRQPWPGNVRELRNTIERLVIMTPGRAHRGAPPAGDGGRRRRPAEPGRPRPRRWRASSRRSMEAREDFEKRYIWKKYQECGGNMSRTSEALQVERSNLYRKMKGYGLLPAARGRPGAGG